MEQIGSRCFKKKNYPKSPPKPGNTVSITSSNPAGSFLAFAIQTEHYDQLKDFDNLIIGNKLNIPEYKKHGPKYQTKYL